MVLLRLHHVPDCVTRLATNNFQEGGRLLVSLFSQILHVDKRFMTRSRRVQDRSKNKRVQDLEIATEKWKIVSKVLFVMETLKHESEQIMTLREMERYRKQINLKKPHKISDFLKKSPKLFELYKDQKGVTWCGLTQKAEEMLEEQDKLQKEQNDKLVEYVSRFLMMSVDKRLQVDKIAHFRRDMGLPDDFRESWIHSFPENFKVVKDDDHVEYLELVTWNPKWAVTELEKKLGVANLDNPPCPGLLNLPFPLKFPENYKKVFRYGGAIEHFQNRSYLSPYADARDLKPGSLEFDKRAVAVMHELLSFTLEKRLVVDHLTHFRKEFVMPQKLMRLLLKHFGIFYVSERGKRFNAYLNEAYNGSDLIEKCPLVQWKEKLQGLVGYRGRKRRIEMFDGHSEGEEGNNFEGILDNRYLDALEDTCTGAGSDGSEIDVGEIEKEY
ncbi:protein WHAT'S THIS FACTOR 1 homolog, chloroplastic [Nymphaea colorata]|nr:protein WHAT'S THIS FACTOR 1 homolog, chloroplastic [Nymphaea colorata]XP_031475645.1 protein WHAT'S THIS FACTOR 1 homolog, chloroplastic [Nymphaea colorata]XP_031475647.1 protein WHAT'S THIS FACTOR 1 homolog, chloroplastic [Nymphaea colorata]XP_049931908.1 protein WHAT'S THIS FACTOR 1 homolog, chloroplastic [Nymphaea colorata]XP_049931909.1 protein WHAT'S THIS FACTOR 1 homolog, chloroplastic [Nymphaea colorata]